MASDGISARQCQEGTLSAVKTWMQVAVGIDPVSERRKEAGISTFREAFSQVFAREQGELEKSETPRSVAVHARLRTHSHKMMVAARQMAEKKTFGHVS